MKLIRAGETDLDRLRAFYLHVIENTGNMKQCCRWIYGLHPNDEMLLGYIRQGAMYYCEKDGKIVSVLAVTDSQDEDYHDAPWALSLRDDEAAVVHIFCVDPLLHGQGIAGQVMRLVAEQARSTGKRAVRLDTLESNTPAQHMYASLGFTYIDKRHWYAANTGWSDFLLYELIL